MIIFNALRKLFGRKAVDAAPTVHDTAHETPDLSTLTKRLAASRGRNPSMNSGNGHDTTIEDINRIYEILKPRITPGI